MSIFDESTLEQAIIDKLVSEGYSYASGDNLHRELTDVIIEEDLTAFLAKKYVNNGITTSEIQSLIRSLKSASALPVSLQQNLHSEFFRLPGTGFHPADNSGREGSSDGSHH